MFFCLFHNTAAVCHLEITIDAVAVEALSGALEGIATGFCDRSPCPGFLL